MSKKSFITLVFTLFLIIPVAMFSQGTIRVPGSKASSAGRNEVIAIETMKELYTAEASYFRTNLVPPYFGNLQDLANAGLIDPELGGGQRAGYRFNIIPLYGSITSPATFILSAWPIEYRRTGRRSFGMSADCLIQGDDHQGGFDEYDDPVIDSCTPTLAVSFDTETIAFLRTVASAQLTYAATAGNGSYGTMEQLYTQGLIDETFYMAPIRHWHIYQMVITPATQTEQAAFKIWATPGRYREAGLISFYIDQTGVMRGADRQGAIAHEDDPPVEFTVTRENKNS
jgi:hypothetical protein